MARLQQSAAAAADVPLLTLTSALESSSSWTVIVIVINCLRSYAKFWCCAAPLCFSSTSTVHITHFKNSYCYQLCMRHKKHFLIDYQPNHFYWDCRGRWFMRSLYQIPAVWCPTLDDAKCQNKNAFSHQEDKWRESSNCLRNRLQGIAGDWTITRHQFAHFCRQSEIFQTSSTISF